METDEERKVRLEKMVATKRLRLAMQTVEGRAARLEKIVATTHAQVGPGDRGERRAKNVLDMIWINFGLRLEF